MKTTEQGRSAEAAAAKYLEKQGYKIIARNWRTPRCEIDLVVVKDGRACLVEVKYRSGRAQGDGFEYVTAKKLKQMRFAAEVWALDTNWLGDYCLLAVAVSGPACEHVEVVEV
jgi:putative endonuclease